MKRSNTFTGYQICTTFAIGQKVSRKVKGVIKYGIITRHTNNGGLLTPNTWVLWEGGKVGHTLNSVAQLKAVD